MNDNSASSNNISKTTIDKIQKLFRLATSSNIHEATAAAEAARKLMADARLKLGDIEAHTAVSGIEEVELYGDGFLDKWRWGLLTACGLSACCRVLRIEETTQFGNIRIIAKLIGKKDDADGARLMFEHFQDELTRLCALDGHPPQSDKIWLEGAVFGIHLTLERGRRAERSNLRALTIIRRIDVATSKFIAQRYPGEIQLIESSTESKCPSPSADDVYQKGFVAGLELGSQERKAKNT